MTKSELSELRIRLEMAESEYLRLFGWKITCETPGALWLWTRDFADLDAKRHALYVLNKWPTAPKAYGTLTVSKSVALQMTLGVLDV